MDKTKPTAMMLGRWQPWHDGHQALFEKALTRTGQVIIMVRNLPKNNNNPFTFLQVKDRIEDALKKYKGKFEVIQVPNITNICYGRDVGYKIEEIDLPQNIKEISATKIRNEILRK
jgi:nicotinamide mononucleotide adenylyltransferase